MFIKSKICFTIFSVYEIVAVSLLHFQRTCDAMFSAGFCDSDFKYFAGAIALPLIVYLIFMWIRELVIARRRRRFFGMARRAIRGVVLNLNNTLGEHISQADFEKIVTASVLLGVQKYLDRHPNINVQMFDTESKPARRRPPASSSPTAKNKKKK